MPRKFFKRYSPDPKVIREHKLLKIFGTLLHDANLWHLNRKSVPGALALGLFVAFIPLPSQMVIAAAFAIWFRVNLPIAVGAVWVSNPLTIPPLFYFCYWLGCLILGQPTLFSGSELSIHWFVDQLKHIWQPLLLGCFIVGTSSALMGYIVTVSLWRLSIIRVIQRRKLQRQLRRENKQDPI